MSKDEGMGWLERARQDRDDRQRKLEGIFGGAKQSYDQRQERLKGLFGNAEPEPEEPSPLADFVDRAKADKDARQKDEATLYEAERATREREQKEMARRLFGREAPEPPKPDAPDPKRRRKR